jgi:hypothetical protein
MDAHLYSLQPRRAESVEIARWSDIIRQATSRSFIARCILSGDIFSWRSGLEIYRELAAAL